VSLSLLLELARRLEFRRIPEILESELTRATHEESSYTELLERLWREELHAKNDSACDRRIAAARIPAIWGLETFPYELQPGIKRSVIHELASLDFLAQSKNVVLIGDTGVGKTGIATGLLLKGLQAGKRGRFIKAQDLFDELYQSLADRSSQRRLRHFARLEILLVDELSYLTLKPEQTNLFFKLMDERYTNRKSTLITTNLEYGEWGRFLNNPEMAPALTDRIQDRCHTIRIKGPSLRGEENREPASPRKKRTAKSA
jgi:DNA replication protein DnaC